MFSDRSKPQLPIWKKTATNSNRNGNNEETASSAGEGTNRNAVTTTATISARSPRKMKTQIAKLVYDPTTTKTNRDVFVNENETTPPVIVGEDEFQKKRQDRDREVKEIQEMLNEITNTPTKEKKSGGEEAKQQQERPVTKKLAQPVKRSKTETNLRPPAARRSQLKVEPKTARSKSAHSVGKEKSASPKMGQKTYSSEEARRYMQEQKKKRKSLQVGTDEKPAIDRSEIKKRLDNLRKNTRQIVKKNVKMAQRKAVNKPCEEMTIPQQVPPKEIQIVTARVNVESEKAAKKIEQPKDPSPLSENYKKIGLLRKPEIKDHSFSAIKDLNMDKENLILDILTPQLLDVPTSRLKDVIEVEPKKPEVVLRDKRESSVYLELYRHPEQSKKSDSSAPSSKRNNILELDLKIPEARLRSHISLREKSVQVDRSVQSSSKLQQQKSAELPFWLKPTAAQSYPYNFIMAVRKKLQAIASPPAVATSSIDIQSKRRSTETPVSYPKSTNAKRRLIESDDKSLTRSKETLTDHRSEMTSNFSSISIQLPESNTVSTLKTKDEKRTIAELKPLRFDDDDTTVSSSVFSSPEKKKNLSLRSKNPPDVGALSPLSMANITNLHIQSKSMLTNVTLDRGDQFSDSSSHRRVDTGTIMSRSKGSVNFSQLLDDFNRSLSQVIEVNHQLKSTLVKSHQILSPDENKRQSATELKNGKSIELAEYVSDFEESSNAAEKQANESNGTRISSSIPEIDTASYKASEVQTTPPLSSTEGFAEEESSIQSSAEEVQSQRRSTESLVTHTFVVSSEDPAYESPRTQTIYEEALEESPSKDNMSANQFSRDSLETSTREEYIKSHINNMRGDFPDEHSEAGPPPSYKATSTQDTTDRSQSNRVNSSLDSEFVRVFNKSDMEMSVLSLSRSLSESTVNYSSIGLYEKLIQNEANKSEHLAALLKMREKALIDRTKGQIAWLEVQKKGYKKKGLTPQISAIKKKQRGILLKMEKERDEIKKLLQQAKVQRDQKLRIPESRPTTDVTLLQQRSRTGVQPSAAAQTASSQNQKPKSQHHLYQHQLQSVRAKPSAIVRGYELETSRSLEQLLHKREEDLRRRREHVERLMEWHRRLDQEEAEVFQLERMLLDYNNVHAQQENAQEDSPSQAKMEKKLKEIDRSLRELSSISGGEGSAERSVDYVRTTGSKLNKLWRRLTSRRAEKFEPNKRYKLCKADLEQLYEEAKLAVLHDFGENANQIEMFLSHTSISTAQQSIVDVEVPQLNLNFSSGQSDADLAKGNYSPSAAEEEFVGFTGPSTSDGFSEESGKQKRKSDRSLPYSEKSSRSSSQIAAKSTRDCKQAVRPGSSGSAKTEITPGSELTNTTVSDQTNVPESGVNSALTGSERTNSSKTESNRVIQSIWNYNGLGCGSLASNSLDFLPDGASTAGVSTETERKLTSLSDCALFSDACAKTERGHTTLAESAKNNRATESEIILSNGFMGSASLKQNSGSTVLDRVSTANRTKSESVTNFIESSSNRPAFVPETTLNRVSSAKTESNRSSMIETTSLAAVSATTESPVESGLTESILRSSLTCKTESNPSSLVGGASNNGIGVTSKTESERISLPTQTESTPTVPLDGGSQTVHSSFYTDAEGAVTPASDNDRTTSPPESTGPSSQAENKLLTLSETEKRSNYTQSLIASRNRSSEDSCNVSSIVNSLLQCSGGTLISQSIGIAELSRLPPKSFSDDEMRARTNGYQQSEDNTEPVTNQSEFNEETCATLRSISSIDNSTNSKHSASYSSKPDPSSIENIQSREDNQSDITPSQKKTPKDATYSSALDSSVASSNQVRSSVIMINVQSPTQEDDSKTFTNAFYASDFTECEESINDISLPNFEITGEEEEDFLELSTSQLMCSSDTNDLEKRLIDLDGSLKDLNATFEKALSPDKAASPPRDSKHSSDNGLMPDIISEVELGRRQQLMLENEMKQFEHAVPYMYVREIPNKPPPPYVPPAHGSPMTTIFPSEERIKDITYRRTKELYHEILHIDTTDDQGKKPPSVLDENITNIYERIILDICKEYLTEYEQVLTSADPNNFHSPLAFFNPPNRLKCMQDFIYKEVRKSLAMDKNSPKRNQVYSVYGHRGKRDYVGEIIIQEMYEEDDQWSNFYVQEGEVLELIIEEMIGAAVTEIATEVLEKHVLRDTLAAVPSAVVRSNST